MEHIQEASTNSLLLGTFTIRGKKHRTYLHAGRLIWQMINEPFTQHSIIVAQVLAVEPVHNSINCCIEVGTQETLLNSCDTETEPSHTQHVAFTLHWAEENRKRQWRHRKVIMSHPNPQQISLWVSTLRNIISGFMQRPRHLLIFVNPVGGKRQGEAILKKKFLPLLELMGVMSDVVVTQGPYHAHELLQSKSLDKYDGVVCVGGDGTLAEVLGGLLIRTARNMGVNLDAGAAPCSPTLRLAVIPAGSTDAVACSLHGTNDIVTAILHILLGGSKGVDVCCIHEDTRDELAGKLLRFGVSMMGYGFLGDVVECSEKCRWLGPHRYDFAGGVWKNISGNFFMLNAANLSCSCKRCPQGMTPNCHAGDGCMDIVIVRKTSRINILKLLIRLSSTTKTIFDLPFVEVHRTHEMIFQPAVTKNSNKTSKWNVDGELMYSPSVKIRVEKQLVKMFAQSEKLADEQE
ncbi:hypothetical protein B566_EDAN003812 [Ephemera danica]|nr:hypothetical protein B566_EDAN003812 [Ephemera danica]